MNDKKRLVLLSSQKNNKLNQDTFFAPVALYKINGDTLLNRIIHQAKEAGINEIMLHLDQKKELFLEILRLNPEIKATTVINIDEKILKKGETYVCSCDLFFVDNIFINEKKNKYSYDISFENNESKFACYIDGRPIEKHYDQKYFDNRCMFGRNNLIGTQRMETIFVDGVREIIIKKICDFFDCEIYDIVNISIINKGYTNIMFRFFVHEKPYIFRFPGVKSEILSNRKSEVLAQKIACDCHIDEACVYIDNDGCRISKYLEIRDISDLYLKNDTFMESLMKKLKLIHTQGELAENTELVFNPMLKADELLRFASEKKGNLFETFGDLRERMFIIYRYLERDGIKKTLCHNDVYDKNILYHNNKMELIDWEFAGVGDPAFDMSRVLLFFCPEDKIIDKYLAFYFGRNASELERLHWVGYICIHCWYYFAWALYRESMNETTDDWMLLLYSKMFEIEKYVRPKYQKIYGKV